MKKFYSILLLLAICWPISAQQAFVRSVNSLTNLRAASVSDKTFVVLGSSAVGDGGGGVYYWDPNSAAADDGEEVIESDRTSNGRWIRFSPPGLGGAILSDGDKGDVTLSGGGTVWTLDTAVESAASALFTGQVLISSAASRQGEWSGYIVNGGVMGGDSYRALSYFEVGEVATPSTPDAGFGRFYFKSDGIPYALNDAGVEVDLTLVGSPGSGDDVHVNGSNVSHPDLDDDTYVKWIVTGTNVIAYVTNLVSNQIVDGTLTADDLGADSVSASELNASGVEAELEAVLDLNELQGQIGDAQIADGAVDGGTGGEIADGSITAADLGTDSVSADELNATGVEAELEAVLDLESLQGTLTTGQAASGFTLDTEWDTIGEIETVTAVNIIVSTEIDSVAEIETLTGANLLTSTEGDAAYQSLDTDLSAIAALATTGIFARTGAGAVSLRTITGDSEITVSNGNGVSGNPTLAIAAGLTRDTEWDTIAEIETAIGGANIIVATEIDTESELEAILGGINLLNKTAIDTQAEFEALLFTLPAGGTTSFDAILDTAAAGDITLGHTNIWRFTPDGSRAITILGSDTDNASDTTLLTLSHNDSGDANSIFVDMIDDVDGTPVSVFKVSATAVTTTLPTTIGSASGTPFVLEGATADDYELTLALTDPTADRTITFPDLSGTVILSGHTYTGDVTATVDSDGSTALVIADSVTVTGWALGASTATTPAENDNDTSIATTAYVQTEIAGLGAGSGSTNLTDSATNVINQGGFIAQWFWATRTNSLGVVPVWNFSSNETTFAISAPPAIIATNYYNEAPPHGIAGLLKGVLTTEEIDGTNIIVMRTTNAVAGTDYVVPTAIDTTAELETLQGSVNILLETEIDASSELRALMDDESGTGALLFADGAIGAATATTPSAGDNDTSVATTAFVQTEVDATQTGSHASPTTSNPLAPTWSGPMHAVWYGATGEIDLPAASGYSGRGIIIYNTGAFTITMDPNGSEVIVRDGTVQSAGISMTLSSGAGNYVSLYCDGTRWISLGFKGTLAVGS